MNADLITAKEAVSDIRDESSILLGGFGVIQGWPHELLLALRDHGARNLTLICNSPGFGPFSSNSDREWPNLETRRIVRRLFVPNNGPIGSNIGRDGRFRSDAPYY